MINLQKTQGELDTLSIDGLRERFADVLGYRSESRSRLFLIRKILWGLQAAERGDLPPDVQQAAIKLADTRVLQHKLPSRRKKRTQVETHLVRFSRDTRMPPVGTVLSRPYKGTEIHMRIERDGIEWNGELFSSLSAAVTAATGTRWNGYAFFGLQEGRR